VMLLGTASDKGVRRSDVSARMQCLSWVNPLQCYKAQSLAIQTLL
jgi:hypothetical protein